MLGLEPAVLPPDAVEVGRILDAWGIKGWFKIQPYSAQPEALFSCRRWFVQLRPQGPAEPDGTWLLPVRDAREHADYIVAGSPAVAGRTEAERLKGARIFVPRSSFPSAGQDEYYWVDLIGLDVVNREGVRLGQVTDLMPTGPSSVLVLTHEESGKMIERLIPFVSAYVDQVDLPGRRILVDWQPDF